MDWRVLAIVVLMPTASAADLTWHAPDTVAEGQPVFAAYQLDAASDVEVAVWMDGFRLVGHGGGQSAGLHPVTTMAPAPGTMRLVAVMEGETYTHPIRVVVSDADAVTGSLRIEGPRVVAESPDDALAWTTVRDVHGGLMLSAWQSAGHDPVEYLLSDTQARGVLTGDPEHAMQRGALWVDAVGTPSTASADVPATLDVPDCDDIDVQPTSMLEGHHVWQSGTDVRIAGLYGPATYRLVTAPVPLGLGGTPTDAFTTPAVDPFGQLRFSAGAAGSGILLVDAGRPCRLDFSVLPVTDVDGEVVSEAVPNPWGVRLDVAAVSDGALLPGYAFDVRVIRLDAPGSLAWAGTLEAPQGEASTHLTFLPPGEYVAEVYASPQRIGSPDVRVGPDGHLLRFTMPVAPPDGPANGTHPDWMAARGPAAAPDVAVPWPWLGGAVALLMVARQQR